MSARHAIFPVVNDYVKVFGLAGQLRDHVMPDE